MRAESAEHFGGRGADPGGGSRDDDSQAVESGFFQHVVTPLEGKEGRGRVGAVDTARAAARVDPQRNSVIRFSG
ncbi:hypothetical protein GCM10010293_04970 [Streptomyces griseoflavus]|nr:hypothetical protein GCM10010293_04970 [Streptomyces griseoflavus]